MMAKAEEDRLKQEVMRLEIRRTEMEMLKEAVRAGIQPHLIPQLFGPGNTASNQSIYTPASPTQGSGVAAARMDYPPSQQIPAYNKNSQQSPRYLPKLDTANLASNHGTPHATPAGPSTTTDQRSAVNGEAPQSAPTGNQEHDASSLFFHHWQPPHQSQQPGLAVQDQPARPVVADAMGSPTPGKKKKVLQQYHVLNANPVASPGSHSRRSPSRGHARHRSDASGLSSRFSDHYIPPVSSNNSSFSRMSHDRDSPVPVPLPSQNPTSHEIDLARKRKRTEADPASGGNIPERGIAEEDGPNKEG